MAFHWNLIRLPQVDSTNTYCKQNCAALPHGSAVFTDCQTSGRGRRGNSWDGGAYIPGQNLALSFLLKDARLEDMGILPLLCALAVRRAIKAMTSEDVWIKWPNDMILHGKKLCGILCESRITAGQESGLSAICGIGINLTQEQADFDRMGLPHAASLRLCTGKIFTLEEVTIAILEQFSQIYEQYRREGFPAMLPEYRDGCITLGKQVRVIRGEETKEGTALDITSDGELLCLIDGEEQIIRSGEASVRGLYGYV